MAGIVRLGGYAKARPSSLRSRANTRPAHTASSAVLELGPTSERPSSAIRLRARYGWRAPPLGSPRLWPVLRRDRGLARGAGVLAVAAHAGSLRLHTRV